MSRTSRGRGAALGVVIITAVIFSVAAFAALTVALSRADVATVIDVRSGVP